MEQSLTQNEMVGNCYFPKSVDKIGKSEPIEKIKFLKNLQRLPHYKTITSQNVSSETHVKNFFIS